MITVAGLYEAGFFVTAFVLRSSAQVILHSMETSPQFLPPKIEAAVEAQHGGPVSVPGKHRKYVVMNVDVYGGVLEPTPHELADSVAAIKRSLAQAAAGQTRDADQSFDDLEARYGS
jgi:hypothetical protein